MIEHGILRFLVQYGGDMKQMLLSIAAISWPLSLLGLATDQVTYVVPMKTGLVCLKDQLPDPTPGDTPCSEVCPTLSMPAQFRCVDHWLWNCDVGSSQMYRHERKRWKWKCAQATFISCGDWYDNGCCAEADTGPSCAGNSGLLPCVGIPPQTGP